MKWNLYAWLIAVLIMGTACGSSRKVSNRSETTTNATNAEDKKFRTTYSAKLGVTLPANYNKQLVLNVADWMGTPYKYGGLNKKGIDCSGFVNQLYLNVYKKQLVRSTSDLFNKAIPVPRKQLKEGDLVFFKINTKLPGHSGVFLFGSYFAHASTSKGVMVSSLDEPYWTKYFAGGGRWK